MATLNVLTDLTGTITRQELFNMWSEAAISDIPASELADTLQDVVLVSSISEAPSAPNPGEMMWVQGEQLMYVFHDCMDVLDTGECTGISLWLAIGPDRFDTACLTGEPIPAGAVVEPFYDRVVKICRPEQNTRGDSNTPIPIGINQSGIPLSYDMGTIGATADSGTWIRVGIDGIMRGLHYRSPSGASDALFAVDTQNNLSQWVGLLPGDAHEGVIYAGGIGGRGNTRKLAGAWTIGLTTHNWTIASGGTLAYFDIIWHGPVGFRD